MGQGPGGVHSVLHGAGLVSGSGLHGVPVLLLDNSPEDRFGYQARDLNISPFFKLSIFSTIYIYSAQVCFLHYGKYFTGSLQLCFNFCVSAIYPEEMFMCTNLCNKFL